MPQAAPLHDLAALAAGGVPDIRQRNFFNAHLIFYRMMCGRIRWRTRRRCRTWPRFSLCVTKVLK